MNRQQELEVTGDPESTFDLRLVPAASVCWLSTLCALFLGWPGILVAVPLALAGVLAGGLWGRRTGKRWMRGFLLAVAVALASIVGTGAQVWHAEQNPVRDAAQRDGHAVVNARVADRPVAVQGPAYGGNHEGERSVVRVQLRTATIAGDSTRLGGDMLLLVPTEQWRHLIPGQEITASGKLLPPRRAELLTAVMRIEGAPRAVTPPPYWQSAAEHLRDGLHEVANASVGTRAAGLLSGLVLGDTETLPTEVVEEFRASGLAHLTAVSGTNVTIVCGAVLLLCRLARADARVSVAVAGISLLGYVILVGPEPSVLRAAVMGAIALLAILVGRHKSALPALAATVIVLLLINPELAVSAGFALSVLATAALVMVAPSWANALRVRGIPRGLAEAIAVPAAAHVATAPIIAAISGEVSLVAVLANLLVAPVVAPATVFGVLATVIAPVSHPLAMLPVWLAAPEVHWLLLVAHHSAALPGATFDWPSGLRGGLLLTIAALLLILAIRIRKLRWLIASVVVASGVVLVPVRVVAPGWPIDGWAMVACDVGQGDGLVLSTGVRGEAVVVDTGPDAAAITGCLNRLGVHRIPLVVLSHLHADHIGGLAGVLSGRAVGGVALGPTPLTGSALHRVQQTTLRSGARLVQLPVGRELRWPRLGIEVLGPTGASRQAQRESDLNDSSIVLRASTPAGRILLTGDIELEAQSALLTAGHALTADVLKVPHHGSRSFSPRFLAAVRPRLAIVSVGAGNDYGHPSRWTTETLARAGCRVERTDQRGDIAVLTRNGQLSVVGRGDPRAPPD